MVGSGYWEAVQRYHDALQAATACVTPAILVRVGPFPPNDQHGRLYLSETPAPLGGTGNVSLALALRFRVELTAGGDNRWDVRTTAYSYLLYNREGREVVAYHWDYDALGKGVVRTPHVHMGKDLPHPELPAPDREQIGSLAATHLPTGLVPFTAVLRAAIRDMGVEPLRRSGTPVPNVGRGTLDRIFSEAEASLRASFTWHVGREFVERKDEQ